MYPASFCASQAAFQANLSCKHRKILLLVIGFFLENLCKVLNSSLYFALILQSLYADYHVAKKKVSKSFTEFLWIRALLKGFILTQGFNAPIICV